MTTCGSGDPNHGRARHRRVCNRCGRYLSHECRNCGGQIVQAQGVRVGTVDKFQGQEAPATLVSFASSSGEDAPRGIAFVFHRNRVNVATSRAQCRVVLVYAPRLLEADCKTVDQMRLVNAVCRFVELAKSVRTN